MVTYKVYAQVDAAGRVTALNSSAFLADADGWVLLGEGSGDRFQHAQGNYLPQPLRDERGVCRYKWMDGALLPRTEAEMRGDLPPTSQAASTEERLTALEQAGTERDAALMELAGMLSALMGGNA